MAGFFYFVSAAKKDLISQGRLNHRRLPRGLADVLADVHDCPAQVVAVEAADGPSGFGGTVLYPVPTHGDLPASLGYFPDAQTWQGVVDDQGATPYWIGFLQDAPPLAVDLERSQLISGWYCTDNRQQRWIVPVVRSPRNTRGNLPYEVSFQRQAGKLKPVCAVAGPHRSLWDDTAQLWDWALNRGQANQEGLLILGEGFSADEDAFLVDCACRGLAVNYRLDVETIAVLARLQPGWLDKSFVSLVVNALIDYRAKLLWDDAQKKTGFPSEPAGVSSTPGEPAVGETTPPAAAN